MGIIEPILVILKIEYHLSRRYGAYAASHNTVLHMKRLNQTESPIFVVLCVRCFQRQSFSTFILILPADNLYHWTRAERPGLTFSALQIETTFLQTV